MYVALKHIHLVTIALECHIVVDSIRVNDDELSKAQPSFSESFPHIVDTALLLSGVALIFVTGFIPFTDSALG